MAARKAKKKSPKPSPKRAVAKRRAKKTAKRAAAAAAPPETNDVAAAAAEPAPLRPAAKVNKTRFVLEQPAELSPKQVAEAAAAKGIAISPAYVSNIRSTAKSAGKKSPKQSGPKGGAGGAAAPAKRKGRPSGSGSLNKSEFIRQQPIDLPAGAVVAAGAARGLTFNAGLVYTVRTAMKKAGGKAIPSDAPKRRGRPPRAVAAAPVAEAVPVVSITSERERKLVGLALDVGLARAVELIAEIKSRLGSLI